MSQPLQTRLKKLNMLYTSHCTQPNVCSFIANTIAKYISLLGKLYNIIYFYKQEILDVTIYQTKYFYQ